MIGLDDTVVATVGLVLNAVIVAGGAVAVAMLSRRTNVTEAKIDTVHGLVNAQLETVMDKNVDLTAQLKQAKTQPAET